MLAYATTIHKSQGSEYPAVVIPLTTQHYTMLARNLLYTGVTRGKRLVVLVGQRKALAIAVATRAPDGGGRSCGNGSGKPHVIPVSGIKASWPTRPLFDSPSSDEHSRRGADMGLIAVT